MSNQPEISNSGAPVGALLFLRCGKDSDFAEIHSSLLAQDGVTASIPVFGDWNILLRLAAKDRESLQRLIEERTRSCKDVESFQAHYCEEIWPASGGAADGEHKATACAVLDVDSGSSAALVALFREMTGVTEIIAADDGKKIILFVRGNSSREIRDVFVDEVRPLAGVLRIKLFNTMN